jgi:outer membrane protein assembly factor BamB
VGALRLPAAGRRPGDRTRGGRGGRLQEVWRGGDDAAGYASPTIIDTGKARILALFTPKHLLALDPATGKVLWREPFEGITYGVSISDIVHGEGVLLASNYWSGSKAVKVDPGGLNPKLAWEGKQLSLLMSNPHASLVWVGGDRALIFTTPGELVLAELTPAGHKEISRVKVSGKTWAHPGFGSGCVFSRTDEEIICVPLGIER